MSTAPDADRATAGFAAGGGSSIPTRAQPVPAGWSRVSRRFALLLLCAVLQLVPRLCDAESARFATPGSSVRLPAVGGTTTEMDVALPRSQVLRRTLQSDPQQEYFLYIPKAGGEKAPLFISVHGISRNALEHATLFSRFAESYGVVLMVPYFTEDHHGDYQRLGRAGRGKRADLALEAIVAEVASLTGARSEKIYLCGFSGGAQFAHRYTMAHPDRVARAVIAAAGWYTFPDVSTPYPYGIGPSPDLPNVSFEPEKFLRVPMSVFVGEEDLTSESLRRNKEVDAQQGTTRIERARNWVAAMHAAAERHHLEPIVGYQQVRGIQHSFKQFMLEGQLGDRTFRALFGAPEESDSQEAETRRSEGPPSAEDALHFVPDYYDLCASGR